MSTTLLGLLPLTKAMDANSARDAPVLDPAILAEAEFDSHPGTQTDASVKEFLDRFPLPVIFRYVISPYKEFKQLLGKVDC